MTDLRRVTIAARVFTLAVIVSTALVSDVSLEGVWYVVAIATAAEFVSLTQRLPEKVLAVAEGALTGIAAVAAFPSHEAALPYLATPALIAGIAGGLRWVWLVLLAESAAVTGYWLLALDHYDSGLAGGVVTWLATGLGLGALGTFTLHLVSQNEGDDPSYRSALDLIRQLHALSGRLTSGLDPVDLADQVMEVIAEEIVVRQAVVVLRHDGAFTPLRFSQGSIPFSLDDADQLLYRAWQTKAPAVGSSRVVFPLVTDTERVAVVLVDCPSPPDHRAVDRVMSIISSATVPLNAALMFTSVRESATSEERQRLAREVHDGVAQDVASLGYLVDNLAASTTDPDQAHDVALLRREVTRVVAELRNSVFDLRNETGAGQGLGQSIASFARHIGSHSDLTVHVTLDESTTRLRPRVEAELLRIVQEAINNARRHSDAQNLWVNCRIRPPGAEIDVTDDGDGLGVPREDSHGLRIMQERADRVGATLSVTSPVADGRGTRISLRLD